MFTINLSTNIERFIHFIGAVKNAHLWLVLNNVGYLKSVPTDNISSQPFPLKFRVHEAAVFWWWRPHSSCCVFPGRNITFCRSLCSTAVTQFRMFQRKPASNVVNAVLPQFSRVLGSRVPWFLNANQQNTVRTLLKCCIF